MPSEVYAIDEATVTIDYTKIKKAQNSSGISLSYNGTIFEVITKEELSGTGTEADPFVIKNLRGFLYLCNCKINGTYFGSKHIKFDCDIELNDETFLDDGKVVSGDGIVYSWINKAEFIWFPKTNIDGKGHRVSGLYFNDEDATSISLFGASSLNSIENINLENVWIKANGNIGAVAFSTQAAKNCKLLSGYIYGKYRTGGLLYHSPNIINCYNKAQVKSIPGGQHAYFGGIVAIAGYKGVIVSDCENAGTVDGGACVGGIAGAIEANTIDFKNCKNTGKVCGTAYGIAGILGARLNQDEKEYITIEKCFNYGEIAEGGYSKASMIGEYGGGTLIVKECSNFGKIVGDAGEIIGCPAGSWSDHETKVFVSDCKSDTDNGLPFIRGNSNFRYQTSQIWLEMKNNQMITKGTADFGVLIYRLGIRFNVFVDGFFVKDKAQGSTMLIGELLNFDGNVVLKNVLVEGATENFKLLSKKGNGITVDIEAKSIIILGVQNVRLFYGSDFSGFFVDYKTGKIKVRGLFGKGLIQGKVSEEYLLNKGYTKKTI